VVQSVSSQSLASQHAKATANLQSLAANSRPDPSDSAKARGAEKAQADNPGAGSTEDAAPEAPAFDIGAGLSLGTGPDLRASIEQEFDAIEEYFSAVKASNDAQAAVDGISLQITFSKAADFARDYITYLEPLDPIPERTLTEEEAAAAKERFANAEPAMTNTKTGAPTFLEDGFFFTFEPDGRVVTRHQNVPVSEESKQNQLKNLRESLDEYLSASRGLSVEELEQRQAQAQEQAEAAAERAESLKAAMEQTRPGQLVDSRA